MSSVSMATDPTPGAPPPGVAAPVGALLPHDWPSGVGGVVRDSLRHAGDADAGRVRVGRRVELAGLVADVEGVGGGAGEAGLVTRK